MENDIIMKKTIKKILSKKTILFVCLFLVVIIAFGLDTTLKTVHHKIVSDKVKGPVKIAFLSDLHSCKHGEGQKDIMEVLKKEAPDVVLLGGDIIDDVMPEAPGYKAVKLIVERYKTFYVSGNHEFWSRKIDEIKGKIRSFGVTVLEGDKVPIKINGSEILIMGIDDPEFGNPDYEEQVKKLGKSVKNEKGLKVLLAHRPELTQQYKALTPDLVLSGHAHGGQWRIPFILNGLYSPDQGLFPKYTSGVYDMTDFKLIVSKGLSRESTRVPKIYNNPEILIITVDNK